MHACCLTPYLYPLFRLFNDLVHGQRTYFLCLLYPYRVFTHFYCYNSRKSTLVALDVEGGEVNSATAARLAVPAAQQRGDQGSPQWRPRFQSKWAGQALAPDAAHAETTTQRRGPQQHVAPGALHRQHVRPTPRRRSAGRKRVGRNDAELPRTACAFGRNGHTCGTESASYTIRVNSASHSMRIAYVQARGPILLLEAAHTHTNLPALAGADGELLPCRRRRRPSLHRQRTSCS